ncbi:hypothetical protein PFISCL1PPCAC_10942, partial [Pristionchus fissidentatus]
MAATLSAVDRIEDWRRKASNYSSTDRLGNLISRSLEVLKCLARDTMSMPDLEYAMESLELERTLTLKHDKRSSTDDLRSLVFGIIESIGVAVDSMTTNNRIKTKE